MGEQPLGPADFTAAGLYDPDAANAADRLALLEYLASIGATIEDFKLVGPDELPALASLLGLFPDRTLVTIEEAAARAGTSPEFIRRVWRAAGFADPQPGDNHLIASSAELMQGLAAGIEFFGEENTMQFVRVLGAAAARLADASISMFVTNTAPAALERDPTLVELARANAAAVQLVPLIVDGFDLLLRNHLHVARRFDDSVVDGVEVQVRSIGFVDLVGSTGLAVTLTPKALTDAFAEFEATSADCITARGGRLVKLIGDEVMFVAADAEVAADIALNLVEVFEQHDVLPPVRAAVSTGDVVARDGDFSGATVNLAARAVKLARPGTLLVDPGTADLLAADQYEPRFVRAFSLKGFDERVKLFRVRRAG